MEGFVDSSAMVGADTTPLQDSGTFKHILSINTNDLGLVFFKVF